MVRDQLIARGISSVAVLEAMGNVPRHLFVPRGKEGRAYGDHPIPIGSGQTISQPYMVARMTEALGTQRGHRVLDVGAGSGYQAAVLAALGAEVFAIERLPDLAQRAKSTLEEAGYDSVTVRVGDGSQGWPEHQPYDGIVVGAASPSAPPPLIEQLAEGGRLIIPIGSRQVQDLQIITRRGAQCDVQVDVACRFVSLIGQHGWDT